MMIVGLIALMTVVGCKIIAVVDKGASRISQHLGPVSNGDDTSSHQCQVLLALRNQPFTPNYLITLHSVRNTVTSKSADACIDVTDQWQGGI